MCGIAGIYDFDNGADRGAIEAMLAVQHHRGPDGDGIHIDGGLGLGHRRLAIIDITDSGAQPMQYGDGGRFVITYNGEVYNYVELREELLELGHAFAGTSDTEVLLAAYAQWGRDCLKRLNGMFAFAIWDRNERTLFCARDRLGVKPFNYTFTGRHFAFASETKALVAAGLVTGQPRPDAIYEYLARGYTTAGRSFYEGVEVLPPGYALTIDAHGDLRKWCWWLPDTHPVEGTSSDEWSQQIAALLDDAVRLRLRSDVPVGAHLSGGLDSSAVVAAGARHAAAAGSQFVTFTGAFAADPGSDEREYSRAVNEMYGLTAYEVEIDVDMLAEQFDRILWHMDEPIAGPGVFPQLNVCDLARRHDVTVVLGGQGGDELFGGYLRHRALHYKRQARRGNPVQRAIAASELVRLAAGEWQRVRRTATRASDDQLAPELLASVDPELRAEMRRPVLGMSTAADLMLWDLRNYLPALLHVEDRTSMAASLESRTPLLDYRLVELALRIPEAQRFVPRVPKPLLNRAVASWLPPSVAQRRDKKGFPTPLHQWRERPALKALVERLAAPAAGGGLAVFSDEYLASLEGFAPSELWTVMTVQGWLSQLERGAARPAHAAA